MNKYNTMIARERGCRARGLRSLIQTNTKDEPGALRKVASGSEPFAASSRYLTVPEAEKNPPKRHRWQDGSLIVSKMSRISVQIDGSLSHDVLQCNSLPKIRHSHIVASTCCLQARCLPLSLLVCHPHILVRRQLPFGPASHYASQYSGLEVTVVVAMVLTLGLHLDRLP